MRDLETCKAEIFRRSEEKIRARTRMRRRVLTMCLPLVLCIVLGVAAWPALTGSVVKNAPDEDVKNGGPGYAGEMTQEDHALEAPMELEDASAAAELLRNLGPVDYSEGKDRLADDEKHSQSLQERTDACPAAVDSDYYGYGAKREGTDDCLQITLTGPDGETEVYALEGNTLTCETGEWQRELDDEELQLLRETLGLTD